MYSVFCTSPTTPEAAYKLSIARCTRLASISQCTIFSLKSYRRATSYKVSVSFGVRHLRIQLKKLLQPLRTFLKPLPDINPLQHLIITVVRPPQILRHLIRGRWRGCRPAFYRYSPEKTVPTLPYFRLPPARCRGSSGAPPTSRSRSRTSSAARWRS